jgi:NAD(P)H-hydrate epimerase
VRRVIERSDLPIVADASALYHLGKHLPILRGKRVVITPHAGEFARLSGRGTVAAADRLSRLRAFIAEYDVTTLLKGRSTLIADRHTVHLNPTGTSALATAGTGDVLTGMIATLLAQGLTPIDAARVGAFWHGRAGQLAARERPIGVIAGDLPDLLARATQPEPAGPGPVRIF